MTPRTRDLGGFVSSYVLQLVHAGHNGAGKSTLIHTLTGLHNPTFGDAFITGLSIRDHMPQIQQIMGICPQHDKLWDELTAAQHLALFGRFKGIMRSDLGQYTRCVTTPERTCHGAGWSLANADPV